MLPATVKDKMGGPGERGRRGARGGLLARARLQLTRRNRRGDNRCHEWTCSPDATILASPWGRHGGWALRIFTTLRRGHLVAAATTLLVLLVTPGTGPGAERTAMVLFLGAILVSAYFGGLRAGLVVTAVAVG